jgi:hypothetical protein
MVEELTLSIDPITGEYTRLTRFSPNADTSRHWAVNHMPTQKKYLLSAVAYMTKHLSYGLKQAITQAVRPANCMALSKPILAAWCWKCRFQTVVLPAIKCVEVISFCRMSIYKTFHGELEANSQGEMLNTINSRFDALCCYWAS